MCTQYWNLRVDFRCPHCGADVRGVAQTHWHGAPWSCLNEYAIGEPVPELAGVEAATIDRDDPLIAECSSCRRFVTLEAAVQDGVVVRVWTVGTAQPVT